MNSQSNLNLNYTSATVASDGCAIFIDQGDHVTLSFWQIRQQANNNVTADVVASVRLHNLEELGLLKKQIDDTLKQHRDREK